MSGKGKMLLPVMWCIAWSRSQAGINVKGCGRKRIRRENFAPNAMDMTDTNLDPARNGLELQYHERIRLKKIAQRRRRRGEEGKDHQDCHDEHGKHDRQRTRGHGFDGAQEGEETKGKGSKAKELGNGFKLLYIGEDGRRTCEEGVLAVNRRSVRIIWVKVALNGDNNVSAYMPHKQVLALLGRMTR